MKQQTKIPFGMEDVRGCHACQKDIARKILHAVHEMLEPEIIFESAVMDEEIILIIRDLLKGELNAIT